LLKQYESLRLLKPSLARANPAALAISYADIELSPGQLRFVKAICHPDPKQLVAKVLRGGGKTKCAAIAFAWAFLNDPTLKIFVLSGTYWQARRLYQYFLPLVTNPELFPQDWLAGERALCV